MKTKAGKNMLEEESGNSSGIDCLTTRDENHPLHKPMSTTTRTESKPEKSRRSMIMSQEICWSGQKAEDEMGQSPGTVGCVLTLLAWQVAQPATNH